MGMVFIGILMAFAAFALQRVVADFWRTVGVGAVANWQSAPTDRSVGKVVRMAVAGPIVENLFLLLAAFGLMRMRSRSNAVAMHLRCSIGNGLETASHFWWVYCVVGTAFLGAHLIQNSWGAIFSAPMALLLVYVACLSVERRRVLRGAGYMAALHCMYNLAIYWFSVQ